MAPSLAKLGCWQAIQMPLFLLLLHLGAELICVSDLDNVRKIAKDNV
jgi:hypothetical protein